MEAIQALLERLSVLSFYIERSINKKCYTQWTKNVPFRMNLSYESDWLRVLPETRELSCPDSLAPAL
jgi:hypothetical protein